MNINKTPTPTAVADVKIAITTDLQNSSLSTNLPQNNSGIIDRVTSVFSSASQTLQSTIHSASKSIQTLAHRVKNFALSLVPEFRFEITKAKIEQFILIGFSAYTGLGAKIISGGAIPKSLIQWTAAAPLLALSAASVWYATNLVDYDSPEKLDKVRKKAQKQPLAEIVQKHGWQNIFIHQILTPNQFQSAFRNIANSRPFREIFDLAKEATIEIALSNSTSSTIKYQVPPLTEWAHSFHQETKNFELSEILTHYPLSDLQALEVLKTEEFIHLEKAQKLINELKIEKGIVLQKLKDYINQAEKTVSKIDFAFGPNGSIEDELKTLSEAFDKVRSETVENHQKRLSEIGKELAEISTNYNQLKSSRPINA